MKKIIIGMFAAVGLGLMSSSLVASEKTKHSTAQDYTPVVEVIHLTSKEAEKFNAAREQYKAVKSELVSTHNRILDSILADLGLNRS